MLVRTETPTETPLAREPSTETPRQKPPDRDALDRDLPDRASQQERDCQQDRQ